MKDELFAIEQHFYLLEKSNKELEQELDNFMKADDSIKAKLRSKTPPRQRSQYGFAGSD